MKFTPAARTLKTMVPAAFALAILLIGSAASAASTGSSYSELGEGASNVVSAPGSRTFADGISLDQAIQMVQSRYRAKVVKADVTNDGGRRVYLIRVLSPEGRVFAVRVDAETGRMF